MNLKLNFITDMPKTSSACIYFMCMLDFLFLFVNLGILNNFIRRSDISHDLKDLIHAA